MFCAFCKFTQFRNCSAQTRNYEIANKFEIMWPSLCNFKIAQPSLRYFEIALRKLEIAKLSSSISRVGV